MELHRVVRYIKDSYTEASTEVHNREMWEQEQYDMVAEAEELASKYIHILEEQNAKLRENIGYLSADIIKGL